MREGSDFATPDELLRRCGDGATEVRRGVAARLAEAVLEEVRWLQMTGELPGGLPWDRQPAWRVRLWAHLAYEQQRVAIAAEIMQVR